ncbi:MAG: penicillin-binding transpeptidase domain-containing protein [Verrucomicrobiota bacterium]
MLVFDQLKRADRKLQIISVGVLAGLIILLAGLWWVQVVSAKRYEANLKNQSFRSVRVPALRGKILDRNSQSLVENRPRFDVNLYLEELRPQFTNEFSKVAAEVTNRSPHIKIKGKVLNEVNREARYRVASNITSRITGRLQQPQILDSARFAKHYLGQPYIPFPIAQNLTPKKVAIFAENFTGLRGVEMEIRPTRTNLYGQTAAHLLGYIQRRDRPDEDVEIPYKYYLPDFVGKTGVEANFDSALRGKAGVQSLLVNNVGYRQREETLIPTEPGQNLSLTIDLRIQRAAEKALASAMANVRGAVVVMDVRNGDILALVSAPTYDPNAFVVGVSSNQYNEWNNENYSHMFNRATHGAYPPGSILKILTAISCLESGVMNPKDILRVQTDPENSPKGCIYVDGRKIKDTANGGDYDFLRAFIKSSNSYFIHFGLKAGLKKLVEVGERFYLGESTGILPGEEVAGGYPHSDNLKSWGGNTANLCFGQDVTVTPLQMALMTSAVANGGKLFWPRVIKNLQSADAEIEIDSFHPGVLRADLHLNPRHVEIIHRAMLADVEDPDGSGRAAAMKGFHITGKTGTAQFTKGKQMDHITWFVSFAPFEKPKYAVVVMVESGASGGGTCAPVAGKIYEAIQKIEQGPMSAKTVAHLN